MAELMTSESKTDLLSAGEHQMLAAHLGPGFDLVKAARATGGTLATGRAYLLVERTTALHFLFPFGSVVSITTNPTDVNTDIEEFKSYASSAHKVVKDEFRLRVAPGENNKVEFGTVTIATPELSTLVLVAQSLAQSNTLEHYENLAMELTTDSAELTEGMAEGKMPPGGSKMLAFIGKSLAIRRRLVDQLSVLDPPEMIWEDKALDQLYHALRNNFEMSARMRVVEHKLDLIKDTAQLVVSLHETRRSHFLELIIIILIAVEIILYLASG